jgi:lysophospholipase L1-like esterase
MIKKYILSISILLNISLLTLIFQFRDKIQERFFPPEKVNILFIGDSILAQENWNRLLDRNDIQSVAYGGAMTQQILWSLEEGLLNSKPKTVVLEGGINDLRAGVPTQRVFENCQKIITILQENKAKIIAHLIIYTTDNQEINRKIDTLNILLKAYLSKQHIVFIDMNLFLSENQKLKASFSKDGIHLKKEAYRIWAKELKTKLPQEL